LVETIQDDGIRSPNDLVAVGPRQFYFTNDRKALEGAAMLMEVITGKAVSDVSYYDGENSRIVAADLAFANGINISADHSKIYASAFRGGTTNVYDRDPTTGDLTLAKAIATGTAPDNITIDQSGEIWVADHPDVTAISGHSKDTAALSPVRIYKIDPQEFTTSVVYEDNGAKLSAVSVAVPFEDKLFLGAIYDDGVSSCQL
jgi:arylesterase/paraoxonase